MSQVQRVLGATVAAGFLTAGMAAAGSAVLSPAPAPAASPTAPVAAAAASPAPTARLDAIARLLEQSRTLHERITALRRELAHREHRAARRAARAATLPLHSSAAAPAPSWTPDSDDGGDEHDD